MESIPQLLIKIDAHTAAFNSNFGHLTVVELNTKPNPEVWSIGQIVKHLITINQSYYPIFEELLAGAYKAPLHARFGLLTKWFGGVIYKSVLPTTNKKGKTLPIWEPGQSDVEADILAQFVTEQKRLKTYLHTLEAHANQGSVIHSPASRIIVYPLSTAFNIIVTHEERHLGQALGVLKQIQR